MNSVTQGPRMEKVDTVIVDKADEDKGHRWEIPKDHEEYEVVKEIEELRKIAIENLIKERKQ